MDDVAGRESPFERAGPDVERVDVVVAAAEVTVPPATTGEERNTSNGSGIISVRGMPP